MITYIPDIYPDELVYSWFARMHVYGASLSYKDTQLALFQKKSDVFSKEFIGNMNDQAKELITRRYPMDVLLLEHTMFPQYARYLSRERKKKAYDTMMNGFDNPHTLFSVMPKGVPFVKYCPSCVREDRERFGEAYWHRCHQYLSVSVCTVHGCRLLDSSVPNSGKVAYYLQDAESILSDSGIVMGSEEMIQYASYVAKIVEAPFSMENTIPIQALLHSKMKHYIRKGGKSRYTNKLLSDVNELCDRLLVNSLTKNQIQRALLLTTTDFPTVTLLAYLLGVDARDLVNPQITIAEINEEESTHTVRGKEEVDWTAKDREIAPDLLQWAESVYSGADSDRPERVSDRMVFDRYHINKHGLSKMPQCLTIVEKYRESTEEMLVRRVVWAYEKLKQEENNRITWNRIRLLSNVKKRQIKQYKLFYKHTDKKTASILADLLTRRYECEETI